MTQELERIADGSRLQWKGWGPTKAWHVLFGAGLGTLDFFFKYMCHMYIYIYVYT